MKNVSTEINGLQWSLSERLGKIQPSRTKNKCDQYKTVNAQYNNSMSMHFVFYNQKWWWQYRREKPNLESTSDIWYSIVVVAFKWYAKH